MGYSNNPHREQPGSGVMFWEDEKDRRSDKAPDFKGFVVLLHDYKAGEKLKLAAWSKKTSRGTTLLSLKEDDFLKRKQEQRDAPREVGHDRPRGTGFDGDDGEVPF